MTSITTGNFDSYLTGQLQHAPTREQYFRAVAAEDERRRLLAETQATIGAAFDVVEQLHGIDRQQIRGIATGRHRASTPRRSARRLAARLMLNHNVGWQQTARAVGVTGATLKSIINRPCPDEQTATEMMP